MKKNKWTASFFFTGRFYDNHSFAPIIKKLKAGGHFLGPHSHGHLLYCDWNKRDSLLVTEKEFSDDLQKNIRSMSSYGLSAGSIKYFLPPFEWYNQTISEWTMKSGLQLINYTPGTLSTADYTTPSMQNYRNSTIIRNSIVNYESTAPSGLNGFILLAHIGTDPARTDKFYKQLPELLNMLSRKGYQFVRVDELLK